MAVTPPGWFPDPWQAAHLRWWDGTQWTGHTAMAGAPYRTAAVGAGMAHGQGVDLVRHRSLEGRLHVWAQAAAVAYAVSATAQWFLEVPFARQLRRQMDLAFQGVRSNPAHASRAADLLGLVVLAAAVVFLRWQYSAATVARGLGYPARSTPGYGVASWILPFANFWLPYRALVDCLPPGHPMRPRCLQSWLLYLASVLVSIAGLLGAAFNGPAAALLAPAAVGLAASVALGWTCVAAIEADHAAATRASGGPAPGW